MGRTLLFRVASGTTDFNIGNQANHVWHGEHQPQRPGGEDNMEAQSSRETEQTGIEIFNNSHYA